MMDKKLYTSLLSPRQGYVLPENLRICFDGRPFRGYGFTTGNGAYAVPDC